MIINSNNLTKLLIASTIIGLQSCSQSGQNTPTIQKLTITGSSTVAPLVGEIAKRFEAENSEVRIDVQTGGSSRGIADVESAVADIGMVSRALKEEEKGKLYGFVIAKDGIGIIVHSSNPVKEINDEQVVAIYQGQIDNWKEVGGKDAPITVVNKAEGRSTLELFLKYFQLKNSQIKAKVVIGDNQQGIKTVAGNENAIGYVSVGAAEYEIDLGVPIKLLPVGGVEATSETVRDGSFPLSRPLTVITKNQPEGKTLEFIQFAQSEEVHDLVKGQNLIPVQAK